ncbi:MAG: metallophosphoesterase [Bacteroidales bacterium]|nr:metallophosphoesterase [Bacteroidales bacterium]
MKFLLVVLAVACVAVVAATHLCYLFTWLLGKVGRFACHYRPFLLSMFALLGALLAAFLYGHYVGPYDVHTRQVDLRFRSIPSAFDGYRIVHISDLHLAGWIGHEDKLADAVGQINRLRPDLICFTGDLVSAGYEEFHTTLPVLRRLKAPDGVVAVFGNHDYSYYRRDFTDEQRERHVEELIRMERSELRWHLLLNQSHIVRRGADSIAVIGSENQSCGVHHVIQKGNLPLAMQGTDGMFRILLTHDPTHWRDSVLHRTDIPLTLSGHTHAMQFSMFGWTPASLIYRESAGHYQEEGQQLYVNVGLGSVVPLRIGAYPEITLLTLHQQ